ncbi:hypothetical protein MUK42_22687, partial [Musa troglodytarum]
MADHGAAIVQGSNKSLTIAERTDLIADSKQTPPFYLSTFEASTQEEFKTDDRSQNSSPNSSRQSCENDPQKHKEGIFTAAKESSKIIGRDVTWRIDGGTDLGSFSRLSTTSSRSTPRPPVTSQTHKLDSHRRLAGLRRSNGLRLIPPQSRRRHHRHHYHHSASPELQRRGAFRSRSTGRNLRFPAAAAAAADAVLLTRRGDGELRITIAVTSVSIPRSGRLLFRERAREMGLKKEKGKSSEVNRKVIQGKGIASNDHWAFLEEIEAPMWADLAVEARSMGKDMIHQMPSRRLKKLFQSIGKDEDSSHNSRCHSPKVPESVSRSRGKHYKCRKWLGKAHGSLAARQHPVRELGGKSLDTATNKATSQNSSMSTVTMSSSSRKPLKGSADDNQNSVVESNAAAERSSSSSVVSKYQKLRPKSSFGGPRKTKIGTSNVTDKTSSSGNARCSREMTKSENVLQNRNSSAGKSSVGSSFTHGNTLKKVNATTMPKNGRSKKVLGTVVKVQEMQIKARTQRLQHQNRASGAKFVSQETKSKKKGLATKPRPIAGAVKKDLISVWNKENTIDGKMQRARYG